MTNIGIDIGGTTTKLGVVRDGVLLKKYTIKTRAGDGAGIMDDTLALIDTAIAECKLKPSGIKSIGVSVAGMVLSKRGLVLAAANLGLENLEITKIIEKRYGIKSFVGNDVGCFAIAESATANCPDIVFLAVGTGVNAGVVTGGHLFAGADGASIEYGHTFLKSYNAPCACGLSGCVEQFISGNAIMRAVKSAKLDIQNPADIFELAKSNKVAKAIADEFLDNLLIVLVNICNTYRPWRIVIGGGVGAAIPHLDTINDKLCQRHYGYKNAPAVTVCLSQNPTDGAVMGAAALRSAAWAGRR
jgi:glucokinase